MRETFGRTGFVNQGFNQRTVRFVFFGPLQSGFNFLAVDELVRAARFRVVHERKLGKALTACRKIGGNNETAVGGGVLKRAPWLCRMPAS